MNKSESPVLEEPSPKSRRYPEAFKRDAVRLVTDEKYTFKAAAQAVGVSEKSLRDWHKKFAPPPVPCDEDATVFELEREILKKAGGFFPDLRKPQLISEAFSKSRSCNATSDYSLKPVF